jgi:hypothetical protein
MVGGQPRHQARCACPRRVRPCFGNTNGGATHCSVCRLQGMSDVRNRRCHCGAATPYFGREGHRATHCALCRGSNMVDVRSGRCVCRKTTPRFGFHGHPPTHCSLCKSPGMINLRCKRCVCGRAEPTFGTTIARYWKHCKHPTMVNLRARRCQACMQAVPSFAEPGQGVVTHCGRCKSATMVNVTGRRCSCGVQPYFGYPGGRQATHCNQCRTPGMRNIRDKRCSCGRARPLFGVAGSAATHCVACREPVHVVMAGHWCKGEIVHGHDTPTPARFKLDGQWLCWGCAKEKTGATGRNHCRAIRREYIFLGDLLTRCLPAELGLAPGRPLHTYQHDRAVLSCHSISRPDLTFVLPNFLIVVEFDEGGHTNRSIISELQHLEVIRQWAREVHGLQYVYVLRIDERGLFRRIYTGGQTGVSTQPREMMWQPTDLFDICIQAVAGRLVDRIRRALCPRGGVPVELHMAAQGTHVEVWNRVEGLHTA